jgi:hypothetical protein
MSSPTDRPQPRTRPRPAADEDHDPVAGPAAVPAQNTPGTSEPGGAGPRRPISAAPARRRGAEPTVQLNVRVSADINALIDAAADDTGHTKRELIEHAIRNTYA